VSDGLVTDVLQTCAIDTRRRADCRPTPSHRSPQRCQPAESNKHCDVRRSDGLFISAESEVLPVGIHNGMELSAATFRCRSSINSDSRAGTVPDTCKSSAPTRLAHANDRETALHAIVAG
jgi:hypothetical protein